MKELLSFQKERLVEAVDRTRQTPEFPAINDGQAAIDICHVALTKQLTLFEGNCRLLPPRQFGMHLIINNIHY